MCKIKNFGFIGNFYHNSFRALYNEVKGCSDTFFLLAFFIDIEILIRQGSNLALASTMVRKI
ncbi:MAG: hypothetical protein ACK5H1_00575 [Tenacibaculum sp.]